MIGTNTSKERALLFGVYQNNERVMNNLSELTKLAESALLNVVMTDYQIVKEINAYSYIGTGKLEFLKEKVEENNIDVVIFDVELSGSQIRNISNIIECKVLDRSMLILDIFVSRAQSSEGKLQVELAQMKYMLSRLSCLTGTSGRYGSGGVGMRGPGETKLETDRRKIKDAIAKKEKELEKVKFHRDTTRKQRLNNTKSVALVGYTNSGKTTLLNNITKSEGYADDRLFATLDVLSKKVWDDGVSYVLNDTVGFVSNLPHELTYAFSATLQETTDADVLVIVLDASDKEKFEQLNVVNDVLNELKCERKKMILAYNKIDLLTDEQKAELEGLTDLPTCYISAKKNVGIEILKQMIKEKLQ